MTDELRSPAPQQPLTAAEWLEFSMSGIDGLIRLFVKDGWQLDCTLIHGLTIARGQVNEALQIIKTQPSETLRTTEPAPQAEVGTGPSLPGSAPQSGEPAAAAPMETAAPNDWHEAQAEIHNLQRDREALRNENARRAAMFDSLIGQLVKIKGFVHPDGFIVNGKGYSFNPPIELVREAWEALSKAIREIEPPAHFSPTPNVSETAAAHRFDLTKEEKDRAPAIPGAVTPNGSVVVPRERLQYWAGVLASRNKTRPGHRDFIEMEIRERLTAAPAQPCVVAQSGDSQERMRPALEAIIRRIDELETENHAPVSFEEVRGLQEEAQAALRGLERKQP